MMLCHQKGKNAQIMKTETDYKWIYKPQKRCTFHCDWCGYDTNADELTAEEKENCICCGHKQMKRKL